MIREAGTAAKWLTLGLVFVLAACSSGEAHPPDYSAPRYLRGAYITAGTLEDSSSLAVAARTFDSLEVNSFVIDLKDEKGVRYETAYRLARDSRAPRVTGYDLGERVKQAHTMGYHVVGRIVVFKDSGLAELRPEWAIHRPNGKLWRDKGGHAWLSPWESRVCKHNLKVAIEAVSMGVDEIALDFFRFPYERADLPPQVHPKQDDDRSRGDAITNCLRRMAEELRERGVKVAVIVPSSSMTDVEGDAGVGLQWESLLGAVDRVLPRVFPSEMPPPKRGLHPEKLPYQTVSRALRLGVTRLMRVTQDGRRAARVVPVVQAFTDDPRYTYGPVRLGTQLQAVYECGLNDWLLWNPRSDYGRFRGALKADARARARPLVPTAADWAEADLAPEPDSVR
jgi:hypothetical protein